MKGREHGVGRSENLTMCERVRCNGSATIFKSSKDVFPNTPRTVVDPPVCAWATLNHFVASVSGGRLRPQPSAQYTHGSPIGVDILSVKSRDPLTKHTWTASDRKESCIEVEITNFSFT